MKIIWVKVAAVPLLLASYSAVQAAPPAKPATVLLGDRSELVQTVQARRDWRGPGREWRGPRQGQRWHSRRYYGRAYPYRYRYGWDPGAAAAAGIAGLATGAIVGGSLARQNNASAVEYCMNRFRSYDPSSGTYLGYDGRRHPCP